MAKGSQATFDGYPRVCSGCDRPVRITRDTLWFETIAGVRRSFHFDCHPLRVARAQSKPRTKGAT